MKNKTKVLSE